MSGAYIRAYYGVPAHPGTTVTIDGDHGTITGFVDHYLQVLFDNTPEPVPCHPTWRVTYHNQEVTR